MDKIVVDLDSDARQCVACGFSESRPQESSAPKEVLTRVSRGASRRVETPAEPVRFIEGSGKDPD